MKLFRRTQVADELLNRVFSDVERAFDDLTNRWFITRTPVTATVATGNNVIPHQLGRTPRGWRILDQTAGADLYRVAWSPETITINANLFGGGTMTLTLELL